MDMRMIGGAVVLAVVTVVTAVAQVPPRAVAVRTNPDATVPGMMARLIDWGGTTVPDGQQCNQFGGQGSTPRLALDGYHTGTQVILLAFNDETYAPMNNGGHGIVGFRINGRYASTGSIPGETQPNSQGNLIVADNRGGQSPGYLPPCSGGRGNLYSVTVMAVTWADTNPPSYTVLNQTRVELGRY